jgi:hypothetical protein
VEDVHARGVGQISRKVSLATSPFAALSIKGHQRIDIVHSEVAHSLNQAMQDINSGAGIV